jgi:O-antigen/teichoic acid export membrane protein
VFRLVCKLRARGSASSPDATGHVGRAVIICDTSPPRYPIATSPQSATARAVAANTLVRLGSFAVSKAILLLVTVYLARYLGARGFGQYAFVLSYLAFFQILTDSGLQPAVLKQLHWPDRERAARVFGNVLAGKLVLCAFAVVACRAGAVLMGFPPSVAQAATIAGLGLFASVGDSLGAVFQAGLKQQYIAAAEVAEQLVSAGLIAAAIAFDAGLNGIFAATVVGNFTRFGVKWWFGRRLVPIRLRPSRELSLELLAQGWPLTFAAVLNITLGNLDVVLLQHLSGASAVGIYAAGKRLVSPLGLVPGTYVAAFYPVLLGYARAGDGRPLERSLRLSLKALLGVLVPIATILTVLAVPVSRLLYGAEFTATAGVLALLGWFPVLMTVQMLGDYLLISLGRERLTGLFAVARLAILATAAELLIPRWIHMGAAVALLASSGLCLPLLATVPSVRPLLRATFSEGARTLLAAVVAIIPVVYLSGARFTPWLLLAPPAYVAALVLTGSVRAAEWRSFRAMIGWDKESTALDPAP